MKLKDRNYDLDLIQAIAIWLVSLQHGEYELIPNLHGSKIGGFGVEVFFVMSVFLSVEFF